MSNEPRRVEQRVRRRFQNIRSTQGIFGESAINVSGSFPEILAPNLFSLEKRLRSVARFKIFSDPFPIDVVSRDFESVLSVYALTDYSECVRSLAFCSDGRKRRVYAFIVAYLAISGNTRLAQNIDFA